MTHLEGWQEGGIIGGVSSLVSTLVGIVANGSLNVDIMGIPIVLWALVIGGIVGAVAGKIL